MAPPCRGLHSSGLLQMYHPSCNLLCSSYLAKLNTRSLLRRKDCTKLGSVTNLDLPGVIKLACQCL